MGSSLLELANADQHAPRLARDPARRYLLEKEQAYLDDVTPDIFGFHALQLGMPSVDLLRESRIAHRVRSADSGTPGLYAKFHELPLATQSIDLVVLPHVLEFAADRTRFCARSTA